MKFQMASGAAKPQPKAAWVSGPWGAQPRAGSQCYEDACKLQRSRRKRH